MIQDRMWGEVIPQKTRYHHDLKQTLQLLSIEFSYADTKILELRNQCQHRVPTVCFFQQKCI